jgi:biopolymer transport protein ExbB
METYFDRYVLAGGIMMIGLIPAAFLAIMYIVQGFINLRRGRVAPETLLAQAGALKTTTERDDFVTSLEGSRSALARCVVKVLQRRKRSAQPDDSDIIPDVVTEEVSRLYHQNNQLAVIYPVAPLMGLLGTITGMMKAFYEFSVVREHSIDQLSKGINEALITTMWGLFIAIPALTVLSIFRHRLYRYETELLPTTVRELLHSIDSAEEHDEPQRLEDVREETAPGAPDDAS